MPQATHWILTDGHSTLAAHRNHIPSKGGQEVNAVIFTASMTLQHCSSIDIHITLNSMQNSVVSKCGHFRIYDVSLQHGFCPLCSRVMTETRTHRDRLHSLNPRRSGRCVFNCSQVFDVFSRDGVPLPGMRFIMRVRSARQMSRAFILRGMVLLFAWAYHDCYLKWYSLDYARTVCDFSS